MLSVLLHDTIEQRIRNMPVENDFGPAVVMEHLPISFLLLHNNLFRSL